MKKYLGILVVMMILFASCERESGRRLSPSGQAAQEREMQQTKVKTDTNIKVEVIGEPEAILVDNNVQKFKVKVMYADSMVCFALLDNKFEIGDKIEIKPTQRIGN